MSKYTHLNKELCGNIYSLDPELVIMATFINMYLAGMAQKPPKPLFPSAAATADDDVSQEVLPSALNTADDKGECLYCEWCVDVAVSNQRGSSNVEGERELNLVCIVCICTYVNNNNIHSRA